MLSKLQLAILMLKYGRFLNQTYQPILSMLTLSHSQIIHLYFGEYLLIIYETRESQFHVRMLAEPDQCCLIMNQNQIIGEKNNLIVRFPFKN